MYNRYRTPAVTSVLCWVSISRAGRSGGWWTDNFSCFTLRVQYYSSNTINNPSTCIVVCCLLLVRPSSSEDPSISTSFSSLESSLRTEEESFLLDVIIYHTNIFSFVSSCVDRWSIPLTQLLTLCSLPACCTSTCTQVFIKIKSDPSCLQHRPAGSLMKWSILVLSWDHSCMFPIGPPVWTHLSLEGRRQLVTPQTFPIETLEPPTW